MTRHHLANSKQWAIRVPNPKSTLKMQKSNMAHTRGKGRTKVSEIKKWGKQVVAI
jgi:hypothetical protein